MLCLRTCQGIRTVIKPSTISKISQLATSACTKRTFTSFTPLRPSITSFRPSSLPTPSVSPQAITTTDGAILDILPKPSAHPALAGIQIRCGPRNTFSPSHFVRKRRHGFLSRVKTRKGRMTLTRRRAKGRSSLSH